MDLSGRESCVDDDGLSLATTPEGRGEVHYSLAKRNISNGVHAVHHDDSITCLAVVEPCNTDGPARENNARNLASSCKPSDESHQSCPQEVSKILIPPLDKEMQTIMPISHGNQSMRILKERLKEKLKEKLKPKLKQNFKNRQESTLQLALLPNRENAVTIQEDGFVCIMHNLPGGELKSDVVALNTLPPTGVKTEPEDRNKNIVSPLFAMGSEAAGQLAKYNKKKKAGTKAPNMSRVNRLSDSILQFVGERSVPEKFIRAALGNNPDTSKAIRLLLTEKRLKRLGDGGKGCAYIYARTDLTETTTKIEDLDHVDGSAQTMAIEREFVLELGRRFPATNSLDRFVWNRYGRMQGDHLQCDV